MMASKAYSVLSASVSHHCLHCPPSARLCETYEDKVSDYAAYANAYFVNANPTSAPGIVDTDHNPILTHSEVYSGVYGHASISFYAFNSSGNKGIACGLNNLQKIRDGEPLGGKASAESDFASDEDDDFLD